MTVFATIERAPAPLKRPGAWSTPGLEESTMTKRTVPGLPGRKPRPVLDRVRDRCEITPSGCWLWTGARTNKGYGTITVGSQRDGSRRPMPVHRATWQEVNGPIPPGLVLDHFACDTRICANPDHVRPVTNRENILRGRSLQSSNAAKTECIHGHPFDEANTRISKRGGRECRACWRMRYWTKERDQRKAARRTARLRKADRA